MKYVLSLLLLTSFNVMAASTKSLPRKATKTPASTTAATPAATAAPAAATTSNATGTQTSVTTVSATPANWILKKLSVGAALSQADTFKGANALDKAGKYDADINSSTAMALTAQITETEKWNNLGWFAAMTVEQTRELSSVKVLGQSVALPQKPSFRPWIASGGANYQFTSALYAFGGLNYTLYSEKNSGLFDSYEMNPLIGYQYGIGAKVQKASLELSMREVAYDMSLRKDSLKLEGRSTLVGLNLSARYNF